MTGGPTTELINGIVAVIFGAPGSAMSITDKLSWPGARMIGLKSWSTPFFSSLPTIKVWATAGIDEKWIRPAASTAVVIIDERILPLHFCRGVSRGSLMLRRSRAGGKQGAAGWTRLVRSRTAA